MREIEAGHRVACHLVRASPPRPTIRKNGTAELNRPPPASGGEPRAVLKLPARVQAHWWPRPVFALGWTPDSRHIIYAPGAPGKRRVELWRIAAEGGGAQNLGLAIDGVLPGGLSIHPDGRRIAFTAGREPYLEIRVMENVLPPLRAIK